MQSDSEQQKRELLAKIKTVKGEAKRYIEINQEFIETGQIIFDVANAAEQVVGNIVGTQMPTTEWKDQINAWENAGARIYEANQALGNVPDLTYVDGMLSTVVTGMISYTAVTSQPQVGVVTVPDSPVNGLLNVLEHGKWKEKAEKEIKRIELNNSASGRRNPLLLLNDAQDAFLRPPSEHTNPTAVLIPLREAIESSIAILLKKRPQQEKTRNISSKIHSIAKQLKYDSITESDIDTLANESEKIKDILSSAKQNSFSRDEIRILYIRGCSFLVSILGIIDNSRFKN